MLHIYYMNLTCGCSFEQSQVFYKIIPAKRAERIGRVKNENHAIKQTLSSAMLQYVLSLELNVPMDLICFSYEALGKPMLDCEKMNALLEKHGYKPAGNLENISFNLSHSGVYAVVAVADYNVGIDVEHRRKNWSGIAKRFFREEEFEDITSLNSLEEQEMRFLEYWTMKEAYIKWTGKGMSQPISSFLIERNSEDLSKIWGENAYFASLLLENDYFVSVCAAERKELLGLTTESMSEVLPEQIIRDICV